MIFYHSPYKQAIALLSVTVLCSGFSWGLGKPAPCTDAGATIANLSTISDPGKRMKQEESIVKTCPDGAAALYIKALQAEKTSSPDAAITLYREALAKDDKISEAHGNLGLLLLDRSLENEASVELAKGLMGRPDPRYHRAMARIMNNGSFPSLALYHFGEALKAFPEDAEIHTGLAKAYAHLGQYGRAADEYVKLKELETGEWKFSLGLADVYRKSGRLEQAIEELQTYLRYNSSDKEGHRLLAEILMEKGDREAARREYLLAGVDVAINPEDFVRKGDESMKAREFGQAISAYQTALKGRPNWPDTQHKLGKAQMSAGRDDEAMATFNALVKAGVRDAALYYDLGLLNERSGRLDEAISAYRHAIACEPANVNAHRRLAEILTWRGRFTEAADQYSELIRLREDNPLYHLNLGRIYVRTKEMKHAVSEYEKALRLDPDNLEGHRELASIFLRCAQPAKAENHYKEVLRLNSEDEATRNALVALYVKQKRYDDLANFLKDWLDKAPDDPQRHYRLGIVYEFRKEYDLAIAEYRKSIELQPGNAKMLLALGRTYMKTGLLSESREMLEAAKKADPTLVEPQLLLSNFETGSRPPRKSLRKKSSYTERKRSLNKKKSAKQHAVGKKNPKK